MTAIAYPANVSTIGPAREVSTEASRPYACAPAGALTRTTTSTRTDGCVAPSCVTVACATPPPPPAGGRGLSARKLAESIQRRLMAGPLHGARDRATRPAAFSVTLTCRSGAETEVREKTAEFLRVVARRAPKVALLCVLDRQPKTGRWHIHALALLPPTFDPKKLVVWWRRCWTVARARPVRAAQHLRPLAAGGAALKNDLNRAVLHHLARARKGVLIPGLPPLTDRVTACGALAGLWARVCGARGVVVALPPPRPRTRPSRAKKVSTVPSRPARTWVLGLSCAWCAKGLPKGIRRGARYCGRCCGSAASRALQGFVLRLGPRLAKAGRALVASLEGKGWVRRDAIHAVAAAVTQSARSGKPVANIRLGVPSCACGSPMAPRSDAKTCGQAGCRMKFLRCRGAAARKRARAHAFVLALFHARRRKPFTADEARAIGREFRVRSRHVGELLRQLVEEDGTVCITEEGGKYGFLRPRPRPRRRVAQCLASHAPTYDQHAATP